MRSQFVISVADLRFATIVCARCNTRVTLDLGVVATAAFDTPQQCPRCAAAFDSAVRPAVNAIQKAYQSLARLEDAVAFTSERDPPE
jgi:hypothetical protein